VSGISRCQHRGEGNEDVALWNENRRCPRAKPERRYPQIHLIDQEDLELFKSMGYLVGLHAARTSASEACAVRQEIRIDGTAPCQEQSSGPNCGTSFEESHTKQDLQMNSQRRTAECIVSRYGKWATSRDIPQCGISDDSRKHPRHFSF
jgi:hypothetical protein